jgi:hypothetical protein
MTEGWSRSGGWESFQAWKRWCLREWGRVDPPPPQRPSVRLFGAYRMFSAPEGIQTEVEVTGVDPAAMAAAKREVRWRAQAFLRKLQGYLPDSDHYALPAVVLQSRPAPARRPRPPGATWPGAAAPAGRPCSQAPGQLVAAGVAKELIVPLVGLGGLAEDLDDLGFELVVVRLALSAALAPSWPARGQVPSACRRLTQRNSASH